MPRLTYSHQARSDMDGILAYIAQNDPSAALKMIDAFEEKARLLAENPLLGVRRGELAPDLRSFPAGDYILFYIPVADGITVVRVLHGARDVGAMF